MLSKLPHDTATNDWVHFAAADRWLELENDFVAYTATRTTTDHDTDDP